jgi:hypothetical protein
LPIFSHDDAVSLPGGLRRFAGAIELEMFASGNKLQNRLRRP